MRLQLSAVAGLALAVAGAAAAAGPPRARAEPAAPRVSATARLYADDDRVTVWSPAVAATLGAGPLGLDLDLTIDAVSAASVDVVTSASPTPIAETRLEAGVGARLALTRRLTARAGALVSHERDYDALRVAAGVQVELAERNTTLDARLRLGRDRAGDAGDPTFAGARQSLAVIVTASQLLDRRTVVDATVELSRGDGWHASPYRRVAVAAPFGPLPELVREATPARRDAAVAAVRVRRALAGPWYASATARGYRDDWEVTSLTTTLEVVRQRPAGGQWSASVRGYGQSAAWFWARRYDLDPTPSYRTADRTLGPMASLSLGAAYDHPLRAASGGDGEAADDGPRLVAALTAIGYWFDAVAQSRRLALTTTLSLTWPL